MKTRPGQVGAADRGMSLRATTSLTLLTADDVHTLFRPQPCGRRVYLAANRGELAAAPSEYDQLLADLADELDPNIRRKSELAAEDVVVVALKEEGFPEDRIERVGHLKLGFDVRAHRIADTATGEVLVKRVEVKGRAQSGAIVLTGPEVDKLRQLGERAWLYVITFCKGERPRLRIIQDPISRLNPEMLYRQIQYLVEEGDWAREGEEVSVGGELR